MAEHPELSAAERAGKAFPVSWDQFHRDCRALTWRLNEVGPFLAVIAITRGGLVPAAIVAPKLKSGVRMLSDSVRANAREGDIGGPLREIANAHPDTIIGSYPFLDEDKKPNTNLVVRSRDPEKLNAAMNAVKEMLAGLNVAR